MVKLVNDKSDISQLEELAVTNPELANKQVKRFLKNAFHHFTDVGPMDERVSNGELTNGANGQANHSFNQEDCQEKVSLLRDEIAKAVGNKKCSQLLQFTFDLIYGHSKIKAILLNPEYRGSDIRRALIDLFCLVCSNTISYCINVDYLVDLILSCYDATTTFEGIVLSLICQFSQIFFPDQKLLQLLCLLESNGLSLQRYRPFIWGYNGAAFYAAKHAQKLAFLKLPHIDEIFKDFDRGGRLHYSLVTFPIELELANDDGSIRLVDFSHLDSEKLYDPRFLLPMFYHFLSADSIVKCHKFILAGPLSYTIVALSSRSSRIRSLAYGILARLHYHMSCASYPKDRQLWIGLIDFIRSGLKEDNQRIESVHTILFVQIIDILFKPLNSLFPTIRSYLVSSQLKPYNYDSLSPLYKICLNQITSNTPVKYYLFQKFVIYWIMYSLRTDEDVVICHRKQVFSNMMLLFNSPLCGPENRLLILNMFIKLARLGEGIKILCTEYAIFSWIKHLLIPVPTLSPDEVPPVDSLYKLVTAIWTTAHRKHQLIEPRPEYILYPTFSFELVEVLMRLLHATNDQNRVDKIQQICSTALALDEEHEDDLLKQNLKMVVCNNAPLDLHTSLF